MFSQIEGFLNGSVSAWLPNPVNPFQICPFVTQIFQSSCGITAHSQFRMFILGVYIFFPLHGSIGPPKFSGFPKNSDPNSDVRFFKNPEFHQVQDTHIEKCLVKKMGAKPQNFLERWLSWGSFECPFKSDCPTESQTVSSLGRTRFKLDCPTDPTKQPVLREIFPRRLGWGSEFKSDCPTEPAKQVILQEISPHSSLVEQPKRALV